MCEGCRDEQTDEFVLDAESERFAQQSFGQADEATSAERVLLLVQQRRAAIDAACVKLKKKLSDLGVETVEELAQFAEVKQEL